jgi:hypothetical protein
VYLFEIESSEEACEAQSRTCGEATTQEADIHAPCRDDAEPLIDEFPVLVAARANGDGAPVGAHGLDGAEAVVRQEREHVGQADLEQVRDRSLLRRLGGSGCSSGGGFSVVAGRVDKGHVSQQQPLRGEHAVRELLLLPGLGLGALQARVVSRRADVLVQSGFKHKVLPTALEGADPGP